MSDGAGMGNTSRYIVKLRCGDRVAVGVLELHDAYGADFAEIAEGIVCTVEMLPFEAGAPGDRVGGKRRQPKPQPTHTPPSHTNTTKP